MHPTIVPTACWAICRVLVLPPVLGKGASYSGFAGLRSTAAVIAAATTAWPDSERW
jgi:hypothetical protein